MKLDNYALRIGDMNICIQKWDSHKNPVLAVKFDDENVIYKVGSFNNVESAKWFCECIAERMGVRDGCTC